VTGGISAAAERPGSHVFTAPGAGRCGSRVLGALLGAGTKAADLQGLHIHDLRHTVVALWIAAGATPKEVAVRRHTSVRLTLDRYGHQTIPRPVAEGRCHPVRD
jgi:integrase